MRRVTRSAYRRPLGDDDLNVPMRFYREGASAGGFEAGLEAALTAVLVNPHFLLRVEYDPPGVESGQVYEVSDIELASRLSFFLWSSIPDEPLLGLASRGQLQQDDVLRAEAARMLADPRSRSLWENFAAQWLHLPNLRSFHPDRRLFPDFDDNVRQSMRRETELLFASIVREDRSLLDLIRSDRTYLDERLATHYGIRGVQGSRFRRVDATPENRRGGLLRHGSMLAVTSYATRTSPTLRGAWILENLIGSPPPPPPTSVPRLDDTSTSQTMTVRERLAEHRANEACAVCHDLIDPLGFALENFDAVGRWRTRDQEQPIDSRGMLPSGEEIADVDDLEAAILARPEQFVGAVAEKLLTFALGRGVEYDDGPAIRAMVRHAAENDYRFSSLIEGVVLSAPFRMRVKE